MPELHYPRYLITERATLTDEDRRLVRRAWPKHNRLGLAYQIAFSRLTGRFPQQTPFEVYEDLVLFVAQDLGMEAEVIWDYARLQPAVSRHQDRLSSHLGLRRFSGLDTEEFQQFLFEEACRLEQTAALKARAIDFLRSHRYLVPADRTLRDLVAEQRQRARDQIFTRLHAMLSPATCKEIDALLDVTDDRHSLVQYLKEPPGQSSPRSMLAICKRLDRIESTGILSVDLSWVNNNFKKALARRARSSDAYRLRDLDDPHRYAVLASFLWETNRECMDQIVEMYHKLMLGIYLRSENALGEDFKKNRTSVKAMLQSFRTVGWPLLDQAAPPAVRLEKVFEHISPEKLREHLEKAEEWVLGKKSDAFPGVLNRFSYLRQFAPQLLEHLALKAEPGVDTEVLEAVEILREMNRTGKRKIPEDAPTDFIPKGLQRFVEEDAKINRSAYESATLTVLRDEIRCGNIYVPGSKSYVRLDDFFSPKEVWESRREAFFQRNGLPSDPNKVADFLTAKLNGAYDRFLANLPENSYVTIENDGWSFGSDPAEELLPEEQARLDALESFLSKKMRRVRLADLLIMVDNELNFTRHFISPEGGARRRVEEVCKVIATIIAHGCNIGPYNMAELTDGVTYKDIVRVTDWQMNEDTLRAALADIVNAILRLDTARVWGDGKAVSGDGQRFLLRRKVLHRTYSHKLRDYGLELYTFVADNFAPFYSIPKECTERDAPYALDGLLYHESDIAPEEFYCDTSGYVELNFLGFPMLGTRFCPRIKGLHRQWIYRIDTSRDYGPLTPIVCRKGHTIRMEKILPQWDRIAHFFDSLAMGYSTASTAMKRLISYGDQNAFYAGAREASHVFKSDFIVEILSDPAFRQRQRRGLLKGEQVHALTRDLYYGKRGRVDTRDFHRQASAASCLTTIVAAIVYFQIKEIERVLSEADPESVGVDTSMLEHVSPVGWHNVLLYGQHHLNRDLVR